MLSGNINSCFLHQLATLEVQTAAFLSHPCAAGTNSCFINQRFLLLIWQGARFVVFVLLHKNFCNNVSIVCALNINYYG